MQAISKSLLFPAPLSCFLPCSQSLVSFSLSPFWVPLSSSFFPCCFSCLYISVLSRLSLFQFRVPCFSFTHFTLSFSLSIVLVSCSFVLLFLPDFEFNQIDPSTKKTSSLSVFQGRLLASTFVFFLKPLSLPAETHTLGWHWPEKSCQGIGKWSILLRKTDTHLVSPRKIRKWCWTFDHPSFMSSRYFFEPPPSSSSNCFPHLFLVVIRTERDRERQEAHKRRYKREQRERERTRGRERERTER